MGMCTLMAAAWLQVRAMQSHGAAQVVFTWRQPGVPAEDAVFSECGSMNMFFFLELADGSRSARSQMPIDVI